MLSAEERYRLLEEATELSERWESQAIDERLSGFPHDVILSEPELGHLLSLALYRSGRQREAYDWVEKLTDPCRNHSAVLYGRHILLKGSLYVEQGDLDGGSALFERAAAIAAQVGDQRQAAFSAVNSGVVSVIRCEWQPGLAAFRRAVAIYTQLGETTGMAHCAHNMGMVYREMGKLSAAGDMLDYAVQQYGVTSNFTQLASTESERALLFHATNDIGLAEAAAARSLNLALTYNNLRQEGETLRVFGIIRRTQGEYAAAKMHLDRALMLARQTNTAMLEAEANEELAVVARIQKSFAVADARAEQAKAIFERLGAASRAERVYETLHFP